MRVESLEQQNKLKRTWLEVKKRVIAVCLMTTLTFNFIVFIETTKDMKGVVYLTSFAAGLTVFLISSLITEWEQLRKLIGIPKREKDDN